MKPRGDDNDFNTPEEMFVRATFLLCLAAFTGGVVSLFTGAVAHELRFIALGVLLLAVSGLARSWLCRRGRFDRMEAAFDGLGDPRPPTDAARIAELVRLLRRWEELE